MPAIADDFEPEFRALLDKWGSEEAIYRHLRAEMETINQRCFGGRLVLPGLQIKPTWLSGGLMGAGHAGADYEPAEDHRDAIVGVFATTLLDEGVARKALAHELVHHWEHTLGRAKRASAYPKELDSLIAARFPRPVRARQWGAAHSRRFIAKLWSLATLLDEPINDLLFGPKGSPRSRVP